MAEHGNQFIFDGEPKNVALGQGVTLNWEGRPDYKGAVFQGAHRLTTFRLPKGAKHQFNINYMDQQDDQIAIKKMEITVSRP